VPVTVASYHARPGPEKGRSTLAVAHYFELNLGASILGLDANSPAVDHPDHSLSRYHWRHAPFAHCEPALIGARPLRRHRMDDAFRRFLTDDDLDRIRSERPEGPLAVTYDRDNGPDTVTGSRYDSVWITPEFDVLHVNHLWEHDPSTGHGEPIGGSDHAMVTVDLAARSMVRAREVGEDVIDHVLRTELVTPGATLRFNPEPLPAAERDLLQKLDGRTLSATFVANRHRPLRWVHDGNDYGLLELARHVTSEAGIDLPARPAGPNWWIVEQQNRTLAELSSDAPYM
jgi:hypothetical protein